jgi:hypothetical protein
MSTDRGVHWSVLDNTPASVLHPHNDQHAWAFGQPNILSIYPVYSGNDGGIWRFNPKPFNNPGLGSWDSLNTVGLQTILSNGVGINPTSTEILLEGSQDNGIALRQSGTSNSWMYIGGDDSRISRFDPNNGKIAYSADNGFYRSDDGGQTWQGKGNGMDYPGMCAPFAIDHSNTARLIIGGLHQVFETRNRGDLWKPISSPLDGGEADNLITGLDYASNDNIIYVIYKDGKVFKTITDGQLLLNPWSEIDHQTPWGGELANIVVDPNNSEIAYLTTWAGVYNPGKIWRTLTGGATWEDMTGDLPKFPIESIVLYHSPAESPQISWLFVGSKSAGVYISTRQGTNTHWMQFGTRLPDTAVTDLQINAATKTIAAATFGRGVFVASIGGIVPTIIYPGTLTVTKHVINSIGGILKASDFTIHVTGTNVSPSGSFKGAELPGTTVKLDPGSYSVSEDAVAGYTSSSSTDCSGIIASGEVKSCTITNTQPIPQKATLIVITHIDTNARQASDFTINISGNNPTPATFQGAESGTAVTLSPGSYSVTENNPDKPFVFYNPTFSPNCNGSIKSGETRTCTITNSQQIQ